MNSPVHASCDAELSIALGPAILHGFFDIQVTAFIAEEVSWVRGNDVLRRAYNHDAILPSECDAFVASCLPVPLAAFLSVHLASKGNLDLANGVVDLLRGCDAEANRLAGINVLWDLRNITLFLPLTGSLTGSLTD